MSTFPEPAPAEKIAEYDVLALRLTAMGVPEVDELGRLNLCARVEYAVGAEKRKRLDLGFAVRLLLGQLQRAVESSENRK